MTASWQPRKTETTFTDRQGMTSASTLIYLPVRIASLLNICCYTCPRSHHQADDVTPMNFCMGGRDRRARRACLCSPKAPMHSAAVGTGTCASGATAVWPVWPVLQPLWPLLSALGCPTACTARVGVMRAFHKLHSVHRYNNAQQPGPQAVRRAH